MTGDIALVGFVLTAEEWLALDAASRAELLAAAFHRDAPWLVLSPEPSPRSVPDSAG